MICPLHRDNCASCEYPCAPLPQRDDYAPSFVGVVFAIALIFALVAVGQAGSRLFNSFAGVTCGN